jgi:transcription elongation factor GreA
MEKVPMTTVGFRMLEQELKNLKVTERPAVIRAIAEAREHGDLSENAEYAAAREKQSFIEGRIQEIEDAIARSEVIAVEDLSGDTVKFGATVKVEDEDSGEESIFIIVGDYEADLSKRKISFNAPIARALIGKKLGDSVEVTTPKGKKNYYIADVKFVSMQQPA